MPSNIEVKATLIRGINFGEAIAKLVARNKENPEYLQQEDVFFKLGNSRLKLRKENNEKFTLIAYDRHSKQGPKQSDYVLTPVADPVTMEQALTMALGVKGRVVKDRKVYLVDWDKYPLTARIHLDEVQGLGNYIEIEVIINSAKDVKFGEQFATELMATFKIKNGDLRRDAYIDQLLYKTKTVKIKPPVS